MAKQDAFKTITRENLETYEVEQRITNYNEIYKPILDTMITSQAERCMDCGTPFCHGYGCPLGNLVPEWNELIYNKKWEQALRLLERTSNFPEWTGRLCPALCESACTLGLGFEPVSVRNIELAIVEKGWENGWIQPHPPAQRSGFAAAVVGSGPAGLAAADELNKMGHTVTVFERDEEPGGLLRFGIPDFKLEKQFIDRRLDLMKAEGITFSCKVEIGEDISLRYLQSQFDITVLAIGCGVPRDLPVPGRDLEGIHFAIDYLGQQNRINAGADIPAAERIEASDATVIVVGGGDTGADCVGTAVRQGAREVVQIEILDKPPVDRPEDMPWPMHPRVYRKNHSHEEGGVQHWSVMTREFRGKDGKVSELDCVEVEFKDGKPEEIAGTDFTLSADLVILAAGFIQPDHELIVKPLGLNTDPRGNIVVDENGMTSLPGIFAAGDAAMGPSLVVKAVAQGREAAAGADGYLKSKTE